MYLIGWSGDVSTFIHVVKVTPLAPEHTQYLPLASTPSSSLEIWMRTKIPRLTLGAV